MTKEKIVLMDPVGEVQGAGGNFATRDGDLSGKVVGFLFNGFPRACGEEIYGRLKQHLQEKYRLAGVKSWKKPTHNAPAPKELIAEVASQCQVVINGIGA